MNGQEVVGMCPDCGWIDHENRYSRCQKCLADGDRVAMDTMTRQEFERWEEEKQQEQSLRLYQVSFWNGDEIHPEGYSVLVVSGSEEEAIQKAESKKEDPTDVVEEAKVVEEVDGYLISLQKKE